MSVRSASSGHVDWAGYQFTVAVFAIAFATLLATLPSPAQLWIERQDELGDDIDVESLLPFPGADRGADRHGSLGVEDADPAGELAGIAFDVLAQRLVAVHGKAMQARWELDTNGGLGEQDFADGG